ncbi:MAG: hypothetical protein ISQ06_01375 [Planctomycetaceae bacterium]|nr:hypothetical protein [Planctomycetaceae bacterium]
MLHGNRGLRLSPSVLGADWNLNDEGHAAPRSILDFYFSRESSTERPINEAKLILVGRGEAGNPHSTVADHRHAQPRRSAAEVLADSGFHRNRLRQPR